MGGAQSIFKLEENFVLKYCFALFLANVDKIVFTFNDVLYSPYVGPLWFLWALFWCKEIFAIIQILFKSNHRCDGLTLISSIIISSIALYLNNIYSISLPFCIMQGLIALVFYSIGWYIKKIFVKENHIKLKLLVIFSLITMWIFSVLYGSVYLESCSIKLYPLEVLGSLGATIVLYIIVFNLSKNKLTSNILKPIQWCGKFSLAILCMHTLELYSGIIYSLICRLPSLSIFLGYGQIVICLILAYIVIRIPLLKNVYK